MKLYYALCCDRHIDPQVYVFDAPDAAVECAKKWVADNARHTDDITETTVRGWLYHATYSCEGDSVCVIETELNKGPK